ncbi:histidinol-phosphatase [Paenibacillus filicis]|uniref:Histidinol-phosphatase n=1 Tax=Paenibacillus gyeongsangnamensis TaxID=3388067 RepID=A0ABT4QF86_9BACL|nr:histidinol-phosphatase [Paenibacillus filicis]MCZ8515452.1 histidinol-phosphatase [Paenibacillus filicis]
MKFDLHTHHQRCGHAIGKIEDYIHSAIKTELDVIGISDHSPFFAEEEDQAFAGSAMAKSEFPSYISEVLLLKEKYQDRIEVLLGMESDFFPEHFEHYRKFYSQVPFDYIIGSVHYVNRFHIFDKKRWNNAAECDLLTEKEQYYQLIQQSVHSGMFDILGHMDGMKGCNPAVSDIQTDMLDLTLKVIADSGAAVEINTSGKRKECQAWFPSDDILERACHYGINVTFGSDSHDPQHVGYEREQVRQRLKEIGFKHWVFFRGRKQQRVAL